MNRFQSIGELALAIDKLMDSNTTEDFLSYQHFLFGCCSYLRPCIDYPKVKEAYDKCKLGLGSKSAFLNSPKWRDMDVFRGQRKSPQYLVYRILAALIEYQDIYMLGMGSRHLLGRLLDNVPGIQLWSIWQDTVVEKPKYQAKYPIEIRRMGYEIRLAEKYSELGVLGDICEDMNWTEEADHFHSRACLHTYGCRWLFNICKGMDGR